jgi:hypothetical protein
MDRDYLLNVSEADLCEHLVSEYRLIPPVLKRDEICVSEHREVNVDVSKDETRVIYDRSRPLYIKGTSVTIAIPFDGEEDLFYYQPSTSTSIWPPGEIVGQELHLTYTKTDHDADSLRQTIERDLGLVERYLRWVQNDIEPYNDGLMQFVQNAVRKRKEKLLADAGLVSSLGIPIRRRPGDSLTFAPPEIRRKPVIRRPEAPVGRFQPEPALPEEEYDYILNVIENMVLVMERSPKAFAKMGEEALRDHILVQLNGHYEGQATGETFNYTGKTDILIRYEGRNVFIAECKFWRGPNALLKTLDQLLGYTSWRDTKTAVLIFNRQRNLSTVLQKISDTVPQHPCHKRELSKRGETHFRYVFHQPDDTNREVLVSVLVFDVPSDLEDDKDQDS